MENRIFEERLRLLVDASDFYYESNVDFDRRSRPEWYLGRLCEFRLNGRFTVTISVDKPGEGTLVRGEDSLGYGETAPFAKMAMSLGAEDDGDIEFTSDEKKQKSEKILAIVREPAFFTAKIDFGGGDCVYIGEIGQDNFMALGTLLLKDLRFREVAKGRNEALDSDDSAPQENPIVKMPETRRRTHNLGVLQHAYYVKKVDILDCYVGEKKGYFCSQPLTLLQRGFEEYSQALAVYNNCQKLWKDDPDEMLLDDDNGNSFSYFKETYYVLTDRDGLILAGEMPEGRDRMRKMLGKRYKDVIPCKE